MLMTGTPRKAEASALEMTVSTAISLPAVNMDDSGSDLPALLAWAISDKCHRNGGMNGGAGEFLKKHSGDHVTFRGERIGAATASRCWTMNMAAWGSKHTSSVTNTVTLLANKRERMIAEIW